MGLAQRLIGDLLKGKPIGCRIYHGHYPGQNEKRPAAHTHESQRARNDQGRKGADHIDLTVGKVDELYNPVDHGIAQSNECINTTAYEPAEEEF